MEGQNYGELAGRYQMEIAHKDQRIKELEAENAMLRIKLDGLKRKDWIDRPRSTTDHCPSCGQPLRQSWVP